MEESMVRQGSPSIPSKVEGSIVSQIMALKEMSVEDLQKKYEEVFDGKKATSSNKTHLWKRIAYRIQEKQNGGLSDSCRARIEELIKEHDPINNKVLRPESGPENSGNKPKVRDSRLPIPGTLITKQYKGATLQIKVLEKGFEYNGKFFKSLTGLTKDITGLHWSGYNFFGI